MSPGKPITCPACPACGGEGILPADNEGSRPAVTCDMCGGAGWGTLDPDEWVAPDGTHWFWSGGAINGWTGWMPHEDGHWFLSGEEFHRAYPDAPAWDIADSAKRQ